MLHRNDKSVTAQNKDSKIPTVNLISLFNSCAKFACCSSQSIFTFLYAGSNIKNASAKFVSCIHFSFFKIHSSSNPTNKNIMELGLGDSNSCTVFRFIRTSFSHKDRYYHLPEYRGADKSLARPTSRCLMVRIFRLMLVLLYIK